MSEIVKLKRCPFCGGEGLLHQSRTAKALWQVSCKNCDAGPAMVIGEKLARDTWNERALSSPSPSTEQEVVTDEMVETASKAYADHTEYYIQFHRGLSSPSANKIRAGMRAALSASHPPKESEWQPIGTAPRDGSYVWLWNKHVSNPWDAPQKFRWSTHYSVFGLGGCWTDGLCTMGDGIDFDFWCSLLPADHSNPYENIAAAPTKGGESDV